MGSGSLASPRARAAAGLAYALAATAAYAAFLGRFYPVRGWLVWTLAYLWGAGLALSAACVGFGVFFLRRALRVRDLPLLETVVVGAGVGLVAFCLGMYAGGALGLYGPRFALALPAGMIAVGLPTLRDLVREARARRAARARLPRSPLASALALAAAAAGLLCVAWVYLGAMTPDAINYDAAWCHLTIAEDYARAGRIVPFPADYARNMPHLASLVATWAFLLPGLVPQTRWMLALHDEVVFFVWTLAGVAAAIRWMLDDDRVRASWAAFFLFPGIFVYDSNIGGAADHYLAFFTLPLFLAAVRAARTLEPRRCALVGILAGGAMLTKYQGVYLLAAVGLVLAGGWIGLALGRAWGALAPRLARWRRRPAPAAALAGAPAATLVPAWQPLVLAPLALAGAAAVVVAPHFLKNWLFYRNPVYPFAQEVFRRSTPSPRNAAFLFEYLFKDWAYRPHGATLGANLREAALLLFDFSFKPHYSFTHSVPVTGSLFTLCVPMLPALRRPGRLALGLLAATGALFAWAMTFRVDRHLQVFIPLLAAVTGAVLVRAWELGWPARLALVPLVGLQLVWGGDALFYESQGRVQSAFALLHAGAAGNAEHRLDYRTFYVQLGESLPKDARLVVHNARGTLGIDRDAYLDIPGQQGLFDYGGVRGPRGLHDQLRAAGVTHILLEAGKNECQSKQEEILWADLLTHHFPPATYAGAGYSLVAVPAASPPPDHDYKVAAIGLRGYADGLYRLTEMDTYEGIPRHVLRYRAPLKPMPADLDGRLAVLEAADALAIGNAARPPIEVLTRVEADFAPSAISSGSFTIQLRKPRPAAAPSGPPAAGGSR